MRLFAAVSTLLVIILACSRVPVTDRKQLNMLPEGAMRGLAITQYRAFLGQHPAAPAGNTNAAMVKKVGGRIAAAVTQYLKEDGRLKRIKNYKWEFNLVKENIVNAWCMPGGKVVVYNGIMPVTKDEAGLAVVLGHEIAHAIARHGNERMSQQLAVAGGGLGLAVAMRDKPEQTKNIFMTCYGVGGALGILKYSRLHESEADKMGLVFMAMAGYDPKKAVSFWERMAAQSGPKPPQFLSTHPSDEKRIKDIKAFLPTALNYYHP